MTDYSVHWRCQAQRADGTHCTRRGRRRWGGDDWFCWQHVWWHYGLEDVQRFPAVYDAELLPG